MSEDKGGESFHSKELCKHCRVCGTRFPRNYQQTTNKNGQKMTELLRTCYNINTDDDDTGIHPSHVCYGCACRMRRIDNARDIAFHNPQSPLFQWSPHTETSCDICGHFISTSVGGRKKKERKNRGRPLGETPAQTLKVLTKVAGKAVVSGVLPSQLLGTQVQEKNIICCACKCIVDAPAQLTCDNLACTQCIHQQFVAHGQQAKCPGCKQQLDSSHLSKCPPVVTSIIENLRVKCRHERCRYPVLLKDLLSHEESCSSGGLVPPTSTLGAVTLGDVMRVPLNEPLTPDEEAVCTRLVKRATSGSDTLVLKTGGQVLFICTWYTHTLLHVHACATSFMNIHVIW